VKPKRNPNQPADGKTRICFDAPDALAERLDAIAGRLAYKHRSHLLLVILEAAAGRIDRDFERLNP
jgi:metal-responsive CopG/Arc/MetJ family transcriptional regulator